MNSRAAARGDSAGTAQRVSPPIPSGARLVARIFSDGHARNNADATDATSSARCSQLSSTSSAHRFHR